MAPIVLTALAAARPVALSAARSVGVAVGYGALAGVGFLSMRLSIWAAEKVTDKLPPTLAQQRRDAEREARRASALAAMQRGPEQQARATEVDSYHQAAPLPQAA